MAQCTQQVPVVHHYGRSQTDAIGKIEKSGLLKMWFIQYHCPAVQLREDILGQVWNWPGRWQEVENGAKRRYPSKDGGN